MALDELLQMAARVSVILVAPSHPGNIGATARAMKTMGLRHLHLVKPRSFPHAEATARAAGADDLLANCQIHQDLASALVNTHIAYACSARSRSLAWTCYDARQAAAAIVEQIGLGQAKASLCKQPVHHIALVFGCERSGLNNAELAHCQAQIKLNCAADYSSLNLASAVQLVVYEVRMAVLQQMASCQQLQPNSNSKVAVPEPQSDPQNRIHRQVHLQAHPQAQAQAVSREARQGPAVQLPHYAFADDQAATLQQMEGLYTQLAEQMAAVGFLDPRHSKMLMQRMRRFFQQRAVGSKELNIWRGFLSSIDRMQQLAKGRTVQANMAVFQRNNSQKSTKDDASKTPQARQQADIIYLDYMATTPLADSALAALINSWQSASPSLAAAPDMLLCPNSSSNHALGQQAAAQLACLSDDFARCVGAHSGAEIIWTSGATEANDLAIRGALAHYSRGKRQGFVCCATEHKAVLAHAERLRKQAVPVTVLGVDAEGRLDLAALRQACAAYPVLLSVMLVNNETGVIQDIAAIARIAQEYGVLLHVDAAQALAKITIDVQQLGIDFMSFSAHKCYGPLGVGALYVRAKPQQRCVQAQLLGGGQQQGRRAGTVALPLVAAMTRAVQFATQDLAAEQQRICALQQQLWQGLQAIAKVELNGSSEHRVPHNLNVYFPGLHGQALYYALTQRLAISQAAACNGAEITASHVLQAMGLDAVRARSAIRFSLGRYTTADDIQQCLQWVQQQVSRLQQLSPDDDLDLVTASNTSEAQVQVQAQTGGD